MKILLTGSSGPKVASRVAAILALNHEVTGVDMTAAPTTTIVADITRVDDWQRHLQGIDAVIHFAALHAPHRETHSAEEFRATNVDSTRRLLDAEQLCRDAFSPSFSTAALRFSRCFPEPTPLMALYRLYRGVDARDVAEAFSLSLTAHFAQFEAINISGETPFQQDDCERLRLDASEVLRLRAPELVEEFSRRQWPLPASIDRVYVIEKAKALLGYRPRFGFRELLNKNA